MRCTYDDTSKTSKRFKLEYTQVSNQVDFKYMDQALMMDDDGDDDALVSDNNYMVN